MCIYTHIYKVCVHIYIHNVAVSEHRELCGVVSHMTVLLASVGKEEERRLLPFNGHISLGCFFLLFFSPLSCPNLIQARRCALLPYLGPGDRAQNLAPPHNLPIPEKNDMQSVTNLHMPTNCMQCELYAILCGFSFFLFFSLPPFPFQRGSSIVRD